MPRPNDRDLRELAESVLAERPPGTDVEVYVRVEEQDEVLSESTGSPRTLTRGGTGVSVRVAAGSRIGFAATSDLSRHGLRRAVETASALARLAVPGPGLPTPDRLAGPSGQDGAAGTSEREGAAPGGGGPAADGSPHAQLAELLSRARELGLTPVTAAVTTTRRHQMVLSTRGVDTRNTFDWARSHLTAQVAGPSGRPRQLLAARVAGTPGPPRSDLVTDLSADLLPLRDLPLLRPPAGTALLLEPFAAAKLLRPLVWALDGTAVRAGKSPIRIGDPLLPPWLELVDDGRVGGGPLGAVTDDEGMPTRRVAHTSGGAVTALLDPWRPDDPGGGGQVRRFGWAERPRPAAANLSLSATGTGTPATDDRYIRVLDLGGVESSYNRATGDFQAQLQGILCQSDGTPEGYVQAPWSDNVVKALRRISWTGPECRFFPMESAIGGRRTRIEPP
ncbi:metallopeptidase TldD-related protein [Kitasatospora sp. NPDC097691]|uniref:metallopeptidase TldD-related protein n=1 Tax=Kitasatospora sp. NPDC097691 TaxID=3157231 RepID=UPI0033271C29